MTTQCLLFRTSYNNHAYFHEIKTLLHYSVYSYDINRVSYIVTVYYFHTLNGHSRFGIPRMTGAVRSKALYLTEYFCTNVFDWLKFLADHSKL